ncbi:MAG: STT3 domain-containing protein [Candidatus Nanohaloarchaea archaeon]
MEFGFSERKKRLEEKLEEFREQPVESAKNSWAFFSVTFIFLMALHLRLMPEQGMKYLQALDPYWIFRQSQHLAYSGKVPAVDFMRYFPYNAPFYNFNQGEIIIPALIFRTGGFLFFSSYLQYAQFFPAMMGALGVAGTYFLGKELYDKYAGVASAFFLATIPGVLHRTSAGFFEKEPVGSFFMIMSLYFFTRAWRRNQNWSGVLSGLSLGLFTISWGGSQMLWLLYPAVTGIMLWLNEDIEKLVAAYTPTVLLAGAFGAIFNPSRFWITRSYFLINVAMLGFLWSRYLVEELEIISERKLTYYTPGMSLLGLLMLVLSPLYSSFVASKFMGFLGKIQQGNGSGTIGGTVAENQAAGLSQLVGQLGASSSVNIVNQLSSVPDLLLNTIAVSFSGVSKLVGSWTLGYIGIVFGGTYVSAMVLRKTGFIETEVDRRTYHSIMVGVLFLWSLGFAAFFQSDVVRAIGPAVLAIIGGLGALNAIGYEKKVEIDFRWYQILPLFWAVSNIIGAVSRSRLIFLAAFPISFMAGYAFSRVFRTLKSLDREKLEYIGAGSGLVVIDLLLVFLGVSVTGDLLVSAAVVLVINGVGVYLLEEEGPGIDELLGTNKEFRLIILVFLILVTGSVNFSAAYVNANSLGGSPNQLWMENLDYMEENTEPGDVILSWWDYGYWFESIGRRAAIADGGNNQYYTGKKKINFPLAKFLTSNSTEKWEPWLDKHSVDYVVLDETMIGKYSAVSQIAHRSNSDFRSMRQLSTSRDIRKSLSRDSNNQTVVRFSSRGLRLYVPMNLSMRDPEITSAPTLGAGRRGPIDCVLTSEGVKEFDTERMEVTGRLFGYDDRSVRVCAAINPFQNVRRSLAGLNSGRPRAAKAVLVPRKMADQTLVRLYLMDGHGLENFEKVPEGSPFDFVKMWEYTG